MFNVSQNRIKYLILFLILTAVMITIVHYVILLYENKEVNAYLIIHDGFLIGAGTSSSQIKELGIYMVNEYQFSLSWARLLPTGLTDVVNQDGVRYYHAVLDELEKYKIKPLVTLYHFDHPYSLQKIGGRTNETLVEIFTDYARFVFKEFGHRVKILFTINEPYIINILCQTNWLRNLDRKNFSAGYLCIHNLLKAHARAYHIYDEEFRDKQNGIIGIVSNCENSYAKDPNDHESANIMFEYSCGLISQPIFSKSGDYPEVLKKRVGENSKFEGLKESRLPHFSKK